MPPGNRLGRWRRRSLRMLPRPVGVVCDSWLTRICRRWAIVTPTPDIGYPVSYLSSPASRGRRRPNRRQPRLPRAGDQPAHTAQPVGSARRPRDRRVAPTTHQSAGQPPRRWALASERTWLRPRIASQQNHMQSVSVRRFPVDSFPKPAGQRGGLWQSDWGYRSGRRHDWR